MAVLPVTFNHVQALHKDSCPSSVITIVDILYQPKNVLLEHTNLIWSLVGWSLGASLKWQF